MASPPANLFGTTDGDQLMMQEILELLATGSPSNDGGDTSTSMTASSSINDNNHYIPAALTSSSINDSTNFGDCDNGDEESTSFAGGSVEDAEEMETIHPGESDEYEQKPPGVHGAVQMQAPGQVQGQEGVARLGLAQQQMLYSISKKSVQPKPEEVPGSLVSLAQTATVDGNQALMAPQMHSLSPLWHQLFMHPAMPAHATIPRPAPVLSPTLTTPPLPSIPPAPRSIPATSSSSHVLPTGQKVHVMNAAEFDELRRKLRMQTASRRYRKRKKEQSRQKKMQVQELQAELARLQDIETQSRQYEKRSVESLQEELCLHEQEVASLTEKIREAAQEELDWINTMNGHLQK